MATVPYIYYYKTTNALKTKLYAGFRTEYNYIRKKPIKNLIVHDPLNLGLLIKTMCSFNKLMNTYKYCNINIII